MKRILVSCLLIMSSAQLLGSETTYKNYLPEIGQSPSLREKMSLFVNNILRKLPSENFFDLVDLIEKTDKPTTDIEWYSKLHGKIGTISPYLCVLYQLKALSHQKQVIAAQAKQLIGDTSRVFDGVVEIGTPATYATAMKSSFLKTSGTIYSITEKESLADYAQARSLSPSKRFLGYDTHVPLNDYAPILNETIPDASVDLIMCTIGLHHIPTEKLENFVASIARILRPGGVFILRDHDCTSEELRAIVYGAHSIFNVIIAGDSLETEMREYRNFQPLNVWTELLERHGFAVSPERLLQEGDPTINTLIKCTRKAQSATERLQEISAKLKKDPSYKREVMQTFLTTPEWLEVDRSQEYGNFLNHTASYDYPYFKNIAMFWRVFAASWKAAAKRQGHLKVLRSDYTTMNLFIGITTTLEYAAKGLFLWPFSKMMSGVEVGSIKALIKDPKNEIATIDTRIKTVETFSDDLKLVELPRYKVFLHIIKSLENTDIEVVEIAGQKEILCKVSYQKSNQVALEIPYSIEYSWQLPTQPNTVYATFTVPVSQLKDVVSQFRTRNMELIYIHDF